MTWSLKDKCKIIMEKREYGNFAGFELLEESDGDVFKVEDIETLRKKLIKDFFFYSNHPFPATNKQMNDVSKIINKRFGVKE